MSSRDANPLATADQLAVEDAAARLFASTPVREDMDRCRRMREVDSQAAHAAEKVSERQTVVTGVS